MSFFQREFVAKSAAVRVRFGPGVRHDLGAEIDRIGATRALVLSTPQQAETALAFAETLAGRAAGVFSRAAMHTPVDISEEAVRHARDIDADVVVAVGAGSGDDERTHPAHRAPPLSKASASRSTGIGSTPTGTVDDEAEFDDVRGALADVRAMLVHADHVGNDGFLIGLLVVVIRIWGGLPEGVMYAILLANAISPHIDDLIHPRVYGTLKSKSAKET